jgi:uncharacterized protein YpiB (UPF0302 family)
VKKEKYIELCKKEFNLTQKEAERVVNYLEALMVNVIKEEIKMYVERN